MRYYLVIRVHCLDHDIKRHDLFAGKLVLLLGANRQCGRGLDEHCSARGCRMRRKTPRQLVFAALLTTSGISTSGMVIIAAPGETPAVSVSSIPHLAQALGETKNGHPPSQSLYKQPKNSTAAKPLAISLSLSGGVAAASLSLGATDLVAGDGVTRYLNITNTGQGIIQATTIAINASPQVPLATSPHNGIQLSISQCSQPWVSAACPAITTAVFSAPLSGALNRAISAPGSISPGGGKYLSITFGLPPNSTLAGEQTTLNWTIIGTAL